MGALAPGMLMVDMGMGWSQSLNEDLFRCFNTYEVGWT
jgi:hypothetical protein